LTKRASLGLPTRNSQKFKGHVLDRKYRLSQEFDCVVMLTWSDWHTEMRSNRYHYATRFAIELPVLFVQPDLDAAEFRFEETGIKNLEILHVFRNYGTKQNGLLNRALLTRRLLKPLLWTYNCFFLEFVARRYASLKVYHATEDYFSDGMVQCDYNEKLRSHRRKILQHTDLLVAVSEGVQESYLQKYGYSGESIVLSNGCDFKFWGPTPEEKETLYAQTAEKKIAFYQGGINQRLDDELLHEVLDSLPDWEFWFCGQLDPAYREQWKDMCKHPNLKDFGMLNVEMVRELAYKSTVGIMPFNRNDSIYRTHPLKAFEYVATGLPVVTVPIRALERYPEVFQFVRNSKEFAEAIRLAEASRKNVETVEKRIRTAEREDYDGRFECLKERIRYLLDTLDPGGPLLNILILYDDGATHTITVMEHLESFSRFSPHRVVYAIATNGVECRIDLSLFDLVIFHYSVRLSLTWHLSPSYADAVRDFGGFKILFIQDEYEGTENARCWIESLGIHAVYTCVPEAYVPSVYPSSRFPKVEFIQNLTGYVPSRFENLQEFKPLSERRVFIGYRGGHLPWWYGNLAHEKFIIGKRMKSICNERGIPEDIDWDSENRIYGDGWYKFLESCRATLGTESGANVFDEYGKIRQEIEAALSRDPSLSYDEIFERFLSDHEGKIRMNQISPKIFEAVAHHTALILFEGEYSGVAKPGLHYIPLKKDFSNVDEMLWKLNDFEYLERLTERAYSQIIQSGRYSYKTFINEVNAFIHKHIRRSNGLSLVVGIIGHRPCQPDASPDFACSSTSAVRPIPTSVPLCCFMDDVTFLEISYQERKNPEIINFEKQTNALLSGLSPAQAQAAFSILTRFCRILGTHPVLLHITRFLYRLAKPPHHFLRWLRNRVRQLARVTSPRGT